MGFGVVVLDDIAVQGFSIFNGLLGLAQTLQVGERQRKLSLCPSINRIDLN